MATNKKEYGRKWYLENKERLKTVRQTWEQKNPERRRAINRRYYVSHPEMGAPRAKFFKVTYPEKSAAALARYRLSPKGIYGTLHQSAKRRNLDFSLTAEQVSTLIAERCMYCNSDANIGIDRIDNNNGYIETNVCPCCTTCNMMKKTLSRETFLAHAKAISNFNSTS